MFIGNNRRVDFAYCTRAADDCDGLRTKLLKLLASIYLFEPRGMIIERAGLRPGYAEAKLKLSCSEGIVQIGGSSVQ